MKIKRGVGFCRRVVGMVSLWLLQSQFGVHAYALVVQNPCTSSERFVPALKVGKAEVEPSTSKGQAIDLLTGEKGIPSSLSDSAKNYLMARAYYAAGFVTGARSVFLKISQSSKDAWGKAASECVKRLDFELSGSNADSDWKKSQDKVDAWVRGFMRADLKSLYQGMLKVLNDPSVKKSPQVQSRVKLLYAYELYRREKFKEAIISLNNYPKGDSSYLRALLVRAWSQFRIKNYAAAIGDGVSLMKAFPNTWEALEGNWIVVTALMESCKPRDSYSMLKIYKAQMVGISRWLQPELKLVNSGKALEEYIRWVKTNFTKVPPLARRWILDQPELFILQNRKNAILSEKDLAKKLKQKYVNIRMPVQEIEAQLRLVNNEFEKQVQRSVLALAKKNQDLIQNGQLVETDLLGVISETLAVGSDAQAPSQKQKQRKDPRILWRDSTLDWEEGTSKEELWLDEVGALEADVKNACKN